MHILRDREAHTGSPTTRRPSPSELPDTFPKGRRCVEPGCITILSIWNAGGWGPYCFLHLARHEYRELTEQQDRCLKVAA